MLEVKVSCPSCKGRGIFAGMGGIEKSCAACDGSGRVLKGAQEPKPAVEKKKASKSKAKEIETVTVTEAFESMGVPIEVVQEAAAIKEPIFSGYSDEFMEAILDEVAMEAMAWKKKYSHVTELFQFSPITRQLEETISKVARNGIREAYALSKPRPPRQIDLQKYQDQVAESDAQYLSYKAHEKAKLEAKRAQ